MKKGLIIAIVVIVILVIVGVVAYSIISNKIAEEYETRARAEGVPEICIENRWGQQECSTYCEENPVACGRPETPN
jgi:hypothetical protein